MSTPSLREILEAKKAEIEAALRELDRIEALAGNSGYVVPLKSGKSNSQAVLESISKTPKPIEDISEEVDLTREQVYHALTSHRLRKIVRPVVIDGERRFALKSWREGQGEDSNTAEAPTLTDAIVDLLAKNAGGPMKTADVANALLGKVDTTAKNFHGTVASTLSALVKAGRLRRVQGQGYELTQRKLFFIRE